ncbi:MAG TPA: PRC-barrel domain-containing protein [Gemmatimonadaceae bacterium]|nr:PRC-barrel domain-containing protein [Gemmatimonadaceae bacterium]
MSERHEVHVGHGRRPSDPTIMGNDESRLRALSDLPDFRIAADDPDIRNWTVRGANGDVIGRVHDLVIEMDTRQVRYLDIAVAPTPEVRDRHVLLPIGLARLNDDEDVVSLGSITRETLASLTPYDHTNLSRDRERELVARLERRGEPIADAPRFYEHPAFDTKNFWGARRKPEALMTYQLIAISMGGDQQEIESPETLTEDRR